MKPFLNFEVVHKFTIEKMFFQPENLPLHEVSVLPARLVMAREVAVKII